MNDPNRVQLFDAWAAEYDSTVLTADHHFPFAGYQDVLDEIVDQSQVQPAITVLDLGTGTGNLAAPFLAQGCQVWGLDFSLEMLAQASTKHPEGVFVQADLLGKWPQIIQRCFDRVVSGYVFHEFDLETKVSLLQRITSRYLATGGRIVIGDIAFPSAVIRTEAQARWKNRWDEDEYYWAADETSIACQSVGLNVKFTQISSCAGVFLISPKELSHQG
jgi:putative AdoMet-dependent methyltransferase